MKGPAVKFPCFKKVCDCAGAQLQYFKMNSGHFKSQQNMCIDEVVDICAVTNTRHILVIMVNV